MRLRVFTCAEQELTEAVDYYNRQREGLGYEFAREVQRAFKRIERYPDAFTPFSKYARRCLVDRFPYAVLYAVEGELILILNVMNLYQNPDHWRDHLDG